MMHLKGMKLAGSVSALAMLVAGAAQAVEIDLMISDVDGKAGLVKELAERYQAANPDVTITLNAVGYNVIREQLPIQLEAGSGPDLAFVTNLGGLNPHYVDLTPFVDAATWEANYGAVLPWYRAGAPDGIFGFHTEMTVTGPYVNLTMFEEAEVDVPAPGATWEDWAAATAEVMDKTGSYAGMVMDRSGHRMAGPAMSYGAAYFSDDGKLIADDGFKAFSQLMIDWHKSGLMPPDVWPAVSGAKYANGNEMFFNQDVAFYMSGSWNTGNVQNNVGDKFDWTVAPVPCGPAGCGVMPGGAGLVAFKSGDAAQEEAAAKFVAWMGSDEIAKEWYTKTYAIPAHSGLQAEGLDYTGAGATEAVANGLAAFTAMAAAAAEQTPQAYQLQGSPKGFVMYNATVKYIGGALNGELSLDEAMVKIQEELDTNANQ
ncbi:putative arabinose-binding protein precursor [Pelagimonas phthalicica]|uniref:Putative arabinose-binding protein n=1 Tax=Pelagimonas phthalicica TaxID=1037362 RepID=A0A238J9J6_9RHOB|nr:ABC transporter substrate-binding protein [Pelagimonas phthalicica]TDS94094.1 carbohydrate ABC transporter substrate-binding protein (CUT1 family) [Pelagimonas phthalicica]SMX27380.1 putative arabinose-binding protein precursor [Pelagimonas phthalicica]